MLGEVFKLFATLGIDATEFDRGLAGAEQKLNATEQAFTGAGRTLTLGVTAPIVGMGTAALHSSITFESAFAGVRKTVDATEEEFDALEQGIRDMATRIPASAEEIAAVAEAAGQLGIHKDNILSFSEVMIGLGESTNLTSESAASLLAQFANVTQMDQGSFERLGSTIVALGNNGASTEADIVALMQRLAGAGNQVGMSEAEIAGFAAALANVGINAEAGGTAMSRVMLNMQAAVLSGGDELENFAKIAGVSADEFAQRFKEDPTAAIQLFLTGLQNIQAEGGNVVGALENVKLNEIRVRDALLRLAGAGDELSTSVGIATAAWEENTALQTEVGRRYETTESQLNVAKNTMQEVVRTLGDALVPFLLAVVEAAKPLIGALQSLAEWFGNLNPTMQGFIVGGFGILAAIGPVLWMVGSFAGAIKNLLPLMRLIPGGFRAIGIALRVLTGPVGWVIGAIGLIFAAWQTDFLGLRTFVEENWHHVVDFFRNVWEWLKGIGENIAGMFRGLIDTLRALFTGDWQGVLDGVRTMFSSWWEFLNNLLFGIPQKVFEAGKKIFTGLRDGVMNVVDTVRDAVGGAVGTVMTGVKNAVSTGWDAVKGAFNTAKDRLREAGEAVVSNLRTAGEGIGALFRGDWQTAMNKGRELFDNWWNGLNNLLGGFPARMLEHGRNIVNGLREGAQSVFGNVRQFFADRADGLMSNLRTAFSTGWANVKDVFSRARDFLAGVGNGVRDNMSAMAGAIRSLAAGDFQGAFNQIKDIFTGWWDTLNEFLGGLPQQMLEFGKDLIGGLVEGVKSMITGAVDAVKGVGENIINGFKGLLGIESPSKVFHGFGVDIGEGLAQGIESSEGRVTGAVETLAGAVESAFGSRTIGRVDPGAWADAIIGDLEGMDAIHALQRAMREIERQRAGTMGTGGIGRLARGLLDFRTQALEEELRRLYEEMRRFRADQARNTEVQTRRFSMAVGVFDQGVRSLQLARQRY